MISLRRPKRAAPSWEPEPGPDEEWKDWAQCNGVMPELADELFFPQGGKVAQSTLDVYCNQCPVIAECAEFREREGLEGTWGGEYHSYMTEETLEKRRVHNRLYMAERRKEKRAGETRLAEAARDEFFRLAALDRLDLLSGRLAPA